MLSLARSAGSLSFNRRGRIREAPTAVTAERRTECYVFICSQSLVFREVKSNGIMLLFVVLIQHALVAGHAEFKVF